MYQTNYQPTLPTSIIASWTTRISNLAFIPRARLNQQFPVSFQAHVKLSHPIIFILVNLHHKIDKQPLSHSQNTCTKYWQCPQCNDCLILLSVTEQKPSTSDSAQWAQSLEVSHNISVPPFIDYMDILIQGVNHPSGLSPSLSQVRAPSHSK